MQLMDFKFIRKIETIKDIRYGKKEEKRVVYICTQDLKTGTIEPNVLTEFINRMYKNDGKHLNSTVKPADKVIAFMNFCFEKASKGESEYINLIEKGTYGLRVEHASDFLNSKSVGVDTNTFKDYKIYLNYFFKFLDELNLIEQKIPFEFYKDKNGSTRFTDIFKHSSQIVYSPNRNTENEFGNNQERLKDFGLRRAEFTLKFISFARHYASDIALGVCFLFLGGVRVSEVTNLTRNSFNSIKEGDFRLNIKDNSEILFKRIKNVQSNKTKRTNYSKKPTQKILDIPELFEIYENHMKKLRFLERAGKIKNKHALFVNEDGEAMTTRSFTKKFNTIRDIFKGSLLGTDEFEIFNSTKWSTHIGRGVFTNRRIEELNIDHELHQGLLLLKADRGDTSLFSASDYIDGNITRRDMDRISNKTSPTYKNPIGIE
jgi:integrase